MGIITLVCQSFSALPEQPLTHMSLTKNSSVQSFKQFRLDFITKKTAFIGLTDKEILGRSDGVFLSLLHLLHV